jgi:hypothetical protein
LDGFAVKTWITASTLVIALSAAGASSAFAQAGSTGGTLGNTDKSISGDREQPRQPAEPRQHHSPPQAKASPKAQETKHTSCRDIVGRWSWVVGTVTTFNGDGTATNNAGFTAKWICADGVVVVTWNHGVTNKVEIAKDRNNLTIDGGSFTSTRI